MSVCSSFCLKYRPVMDVNFIGCGTLGRLCWQAEQRSASQWGLCSTEKVSNSAGLPSQPNVPSTSSSNTRVSLIRMQFLRCCVAPFIYASWVACCARGIPWYHTIPHALKRTRMCLPYRAVLYVQGGIVIVHTSSQMASLFNRPIFLIILQ